MPATDHESRITTLEVQIDSLVNRSEEDRANVQDSLKEIKNTLVSMKIDREKQASFIGGALFVITAVVTFAGYMLKRFYNW
jgi:hypothetical protein